MKTEILVIFYVLRLSVGDPKNPKEFPIEEDSTLNDDLQRWQAPNELSSKFGYYWSGFDEDCHPVWVGEMGKWNVREAIEAGEEDTRILRKYFDKLVMNINQSLIIGYNETMCEPSSHIVAIMDFDDFKWEQLASSPTMYFILNLIKDFLPIISKHVYYVYIVNTNFIAEVFVNMARPVIGSFMENVEIYGNNKSLWWPVLLKKIPRDQLPERYGGEKDFSPIQVYG